MVNYEEMQAANTQMAVQAATMAVRAMNEADLPAKLHTKRSITEEHPRPWQARPLMIQPAFNWKVPDRYAELLKLWNGLAYALQKPPKEELGWLPETANYCSIRYWQDIRVVQKFQYST